jgi:hypothetical protein
VFEGTSLVPAKVWADATQGTSAVPKARVAA